MSGFGGKSADTAFFVGAIALHGAFLLFAWRSPEPLYDKPEVKPETELIEIDIPKDLDKEDVEQPQDGRPSEPGMVAMRNNTEPSRRGARNDVAPGSIAPDSTSEPSAPDTSGPPADEYDTAPNGQNTWRSHPGLGAGTMAAFNVGPDTAAPASTEAPRAKKVDRDIANKLLSADVRERDKKLGLNLPAAGTISSAAKLAVRASNVPNETRGSIVVVLGPGGVVKSVRVAGMSSGTAADWQAVADSLKASISGRGLKLNDDYAKGAIVTIAIVSKMQMPSGNKPGDPVSLNMGKGGPGGSFDLGDIGSKPSRQVTASFNAVPVE